MRHQNGKVSQIKICSTSLSERLLSTSTARNRRAIDRRTHYRLWSVRRTHTDQVFRDIASCVPAITRAITF
jgi:hypothetical protein